MANSQLVDLANAALRKLGARMITLLTDNTTNAVAVNSAILDVLDRETRRYSWGWATKYATLVKDTQTPAHGRAYQYTLPDDFLRLLRPLPDDNTNEEDQSVQGQKIHTDDEGPINVRYVQRYRQKVITGITQANPAVVTSARHGLEQNDVIVVTAVVGMTQVNGNEYKINIPDKTITAITQASPAVVTSTSHGFSNGDRVYLADIEGMTDLNNQEYLVAGVTANTFQLTTLAGANVDSSAYSAYTSAGVARSSDKFELYTLAGAKVNSSGYTAYSSAGVAEKRIYDSLFLDLIAYALAAEVAPEITTNNATIKMIDDRLKEIRRDARTMDAKERPGARPPDDPWVTGRL